MNWQPTSVVDIVGDYTRRLGTSAVACERIARRHNDEHAALRLRSQRDAYLDAYLLAESYLLGRHATRRADVDGPTQMAAALTAIVIRLDICGDCLSQHDPAATCDQDTLVH